MEKELKFKELEIANGQKRIQEYAQMLQSRNEADGGQSSGNNENNNYGYQFQIKKLELDLQDANDKIDLYRS